MEFKKGDIVKVKDCEATRMLESCGLIKIGKQGTVHDVMPYDLSCKDQFYLVEVPDHITGAKIMFVRGKWLELVGKPTDHLGDLKDVLSKFQKEFGVKRNDTAPQSTMGDNPYMNTGVEITIKYDGNTLDIEVDDDDFDFDDIDDNGVAMLYNTVDTLYRVLGVEVDD